MTESTATAAGAREHARAQDGRTAPSMPTVPAGTSEGLPAGVRPQDLIWSEALGGGAYASHRVPRGGRVRLIDVEGDACAALLLHNAGLTSERLNVADTVKVQWQAYLAVGTLLLSDRGRVLATITGDTSGRHDALCGCTTPASAVPIAGEHEHRPFLSGRDLLAAAVAKHGLERRDVAPNVNLFRGARVEEDGGLAFDAARIPGAEVELRAEMDLLVSVANVPHPLDERRPCPATPLRVLAWRAEPTASDDPWRVASPEARRAFESVDDHLAGFAG